MKKKVVLQMGKGLVLAYIISAVVLVLLAFLMFKMEIGRAHGLNSSHNASSRMPSSA